MSHQFTSGVFLHNQSAWHRLGTVLDGTLPAREAFRVAQADFTVAGRPIYDADMRPIDGYQAITRTDTGQTLSVMNRTYTLVQNEQLIRLAEALHEDATMDAVCVLAEGRKVTFTARIRQAEGDVLRGDPVQQYLVGCTSHDGSLAFQVLFSPIRVVCQNTLSAALGQAASSRQSGKICRIRHTRNANSLIAQLPALIDVQRQQFTGGLAELRAMAATPCTAAQFRAYVEGVFAEQLSGTVNDRRGEPRTARARQLEDLPAWDSLANKFHGAAIGSNIPGVRGSYWGAYQALTEYLSHEAGRAKDPTEAARQRLESLYWGQGAQALTRGHALALAATRA
jgi:phage/plasmid-like protein (TIGR03299 family)